jgi:hypothetical protein
MWLERPTRHDRFWRGSLFWADERGATPIELEGGLAFESAEDLVGLMNARLVGLGGPALRSAKRD